MQTPFPVDSDPVCDSLEDLPRRLDGITAGRQYALPLLRVPHREKRCLHTRRFGTLTSLPPPVVRLPWGPHPPGHELVLVEIQCIRVERLVLAIFEHELVAEAR